ncbi:MAG: thioredoxin family protein [Flavobacteriales bacterium]|nr:thioredoxin family protein [Flavobacteriales bacterium]
MSGNDRQAATPEALLAASASAMEPSFFRDLLEQLVKEGRTTGADQSEEMVAYTKLNLARTVRNEKTVKLLPELRDALAQAREMTWLLITEPWCGDSSQVMPVLVLIADAAPNIRMRVVLRDQHLELMDRYLTHGGRSVPKLIAIDPHGKELFTWGPRPKTAQDMVWANKDLPEAQQLPKEEIYAKVHGWYAVDKGVSIQQEILALLNGGEGV